MKQLKKIAAGAALATALSGMGATAQDVSLRLGHWLPAAHPLHRDIEAWAASLNTASEGSVSVQIFPAGQLGPAPDHYDLTANGVADIAWVNPSYQPGRFPLAGITDIPFLIDDAAKGSAALQEWYADYAPSEMGDVKTCIIHVGPPGTLHTQFELRSPDQLSGVKVRPGSATLARLVASLGGSSVQVPAPEAGQALARGVADAITFPFNSLRLFGIDKSVSYHLDTPMYFITAALVVNPATYDRLNDTQKAAFDAHCTPEWSAKFAGSWIAWEEEGRLEMLQEGDRKFVSLSPDELSTWIEATRFLIDDWSNQASERGVDAEAALARFRAIYAAK
ncbi:TRAP transporter substrate-binding protein [Ruegeria pomeroyi]|nr:TRAP transporter substrate-binding protein [Ruegeria pomeroyi]